LYDVLWANDENRQGRNRVVATIIAEVLRVPDRPGCPLEGKRAVKTYPSRETVDMPLLTEWRLSPDQIGFVV
jgi:hypothetical protein